ncbi:hypothetical protein Vadar_030342 [Vaccinium darrowii]|uniref:Uncharacterized protein n=1 Tax=Vaccinium darrowii TaxID=229202 RepID=A0ACB7Y340_9ERIC|nr:hypothetical protein Vadar_030342 [Vaccinium darrowii]
MKFCDGVHGGLNKVAELLDVERIGICHQAGSDSLLASRVFKKLKDNFFNGSTETYAGVIFGLGVGNGEVEDLALASVSPIQDPVQFGGTITCLFCASESLI